MSDPSGTRALVTGGAGFIGSHLVDGLIAAGAAEVHVVDDFSLGKEENLAPRPELTVERADCADSAALERALAGRDFDLCFNLAVIPLPASLVHPAPTVDRNVAMTTAVCELGRAGRYRRLVQYSSSEVYGTATVAPMPESHPLLPHTPYAASKAATDLVALSYVTTFGLEGTVVRPFNTYGPRQNDKAYAGLIPAVVRRVQAGEPVIVHGDGEQTRDMAWVGDIVAGTLAAATTDAALGRVMNLGSGEEHTVNDMVRWMLQALGRENHPVEHGPERPGDVRRLLADTSLAAELIGYAPSKDIAQGLRETVDWYAARAAAGSRR
ncbi:MAG: GDP-mannose 4,6-dehydratase [Thermoleophilaceae bacterium]